MCQSPQSREADGGYPTHNIRRFGRYKLHLDRTSHPGDEGSSLIGRRFSDAHRREAEPVLARKCAGRVRFRTALLYKKGRSSKG